MEIDAAIQDERAVNLISAQGSTLALAPRALLLELGVLARDGAVRAAVRGAVAAARRAPLRRHGEHGAVGALVRRAVSFTVLGLLFLSILEGAIDDLLEGFGLESLADWIYAKKGGLTLTSTIVVGLVIAVVSLVTRGQVKAATTRYRDMEGVVVAQYDAMKNHMDRTAFPLRLGLKPGSVQVFLLQSGS